MGYLNDTIKGISWITFLRVLTRVFTFVRLAILGRLLTPTQFGYFGIASLLLSLLEILTEIGINVFLIQEKSSVREYLNSAWVVSIARGIVLSLLILTVTPFIVSFFNAPGAFTVIALISLVPFIRGFINPAIITFQKDLLFHKEFRLRSILFFVDVISSVIMGIFTRNAISFDAGLIASATLEVILSYVLVPLYPKLLFEYEKVKRVVRRGGWVTLTGIFSFFAENGDNITVGKIMGSSTLGIYQVAYKFSTLPISEIANVVNQVVFPVFAKFSDDKERLKNAFNRVVLISSFGALVLGTVIFVLAKPIIIVVMGMQWISAIPAIQILSIYGIFRTVFGNYGALFLAVHKQDYIAKTTFLRLGTLAICVVPLVMMFGMVGAGYAMLLSILVEIPILLYFANRVFIQK